MLQFALVEIRGLPEHIALKLFQCLAEILTHAFASSGEGVESILDTSHLFFQALAALFQVWKIGGRRLSGVGIAWAGNPNLPNDHIRSVDLQSLTALFATPGVQFFSLQKDLREADAQILAANARVFDAGREFSDFTDTTAAISNMDLVISVDTSVAHLAGALGKAVWVLLPFSPDWRWLLDRSDSPWYPTARLFRQPGIGDWDSVLAQVREALSAQCQK